MQLNIHHVVKVETETRQIEEPGEPGYPEGLTTTTTFVSHHSQMCPHCHRKGDQSVIGVRKYHCGWCFTKWQDDER